MTAPSTDDDLGARLRAALQDITPLATDPVPPPRFAPDAEVATVTAEDVAADVVVLGDAPGRAARRSWRRVTVAAGVLAAAAVAAGVLVATTDVGRRAPTAVAPGASTTAPSPFVTPPVPGIVPDQVPWRCTAPVGATLSARLVPDALAAQVWQASEGVTCAPYPADRGRYVIAEDGHGVSVPGVAPATFGISQSCVTAATQFQDAGFDLLTLRSRGATDYLEFFGPNCRLLLPAR